MTNMLRFSRGSGEYPIVAYLHSANVIKQNVWKAGECSGNNLEKHTKSTFVKEQVSLLSYNEGVLFLKSAV